MPDRYPTVWPLAPHTAAKHAILKRYLQAWFPKLTAYHGRVVFVDGFAGPGRYTGGEPGSPIVAVETVLAHQHDLSSKELVFLFVEEDADRHRHLVQEIAKLEVPSYIKIQDAHGTFVEMMGRVLEQIGESTLAPAFIMVDPFGVKGLPLSTMKRLAAYPKTELLVSFMYESMARFLTTPEFAPHLNEMFATDQWRAASGLSGDERHRFLVDLYSRCLKSVGMNYTRTFEMRDEGNRIEYDLVFATHNIEGLKAMKDAMWKIDPSGSYVFSDATDRGQLTMFGLEPDFAQLKLLVCTRFSGSSSSVEEIERFVVVETAFRETHFKKQILEAMEKAGELEIASSSRKRRFSYPPGTVVRFS
jgi:three-Cys-motif partner protein